MTLGHTGLRDAGCGNDNMKPPAAGNPEKEPSVHLVDDGIQDSPVTTSDGEIQIVDDIRPLCGPRYLPEP